MCFSKPMHLHITLAPLTFFLGAELTTSNFSYYCVSSLLKAIFNHPLELPSIWKEIKKLGDNVSLYPANYNVEKVRWAMQTAKIISAEKMIGDTALKWILVLDGDQRVIFKPSLQ